MFVELQVSSSGIREIYAAADVHSIKGIVVQGENGNYTDTLVEFKNGSVIQVHHQPLTVANGCVSAQSIGIVTVV